ncbi:MAG: pyrimidine-nucleoside phosphorylase [Oscillospiraceae bacterium]|nr:pyrimidine-nucleoside phosphorylase [Oscillospiraceae bacterium]
MRMVDIIQKKKDGNALTKEEINFFINGYTNGEIPDYQASSFTMAVCFNGMNAQETAWLTEAMAFSGDTVDLSVIEGKKVDKHSTGGVGDKTTLVITPIVAACGVPIAKLSGRGLGHTGGTVDKLESISGLKTAFTTDEFLNIVRKTGICVAGQSADIAPADKKLYALRDVTATVRSMPLIASSIMSKKIAAGSDAIVLDVKTGSGAFMSDLDDAVALAKEMVAIGENVGRTTVALVTNMNMPLGHAIGNSLEIIEAVEVLKGGGDDDLKQVCFALAANMLFVAGKGDMEYCEKLAENAVKSGEALKKLEEMVQAQGGDPACISNNELFPQAEYSYEIKAELSGWISFMDTVAIGEAAAVLGAGRSKKDDVIDHSAGIILKAKTGCYVEQGSVLAVLKTNRKESVNDAERRFLNALKFTDFQPEKEKLIFAHISSNETKYF